MKLNRDKIETKAKLVCGCSVDSDGFTVIEVLVIVGLVAVIAGAGYVTSIGAFQRNAFSTERDMVVSLLQRARSQALANINQSAHGLYIDADNFMLYEDINESDDWNSGEETLVTPRSAGVAVNPEPADFLFEQLSGNRLSSDDSLVMTGSRSNVDIAEITVSDNGRINWEWN